MKLIISPAKSLDYETPVPTSICTVPLFLSESKKISKVLKKQTPKQLSDLMAISDNLAQLNWERNQKFVGDDLKIIEGIGPKIEQLLNDIGILTYRQLSLMKVEFLEELLKTAGKRYASHDPATWPAQAKLAATGKMAELKRLQERIHYGNLDA